MNSFSVLDSNIDKFSKSNITQWGDQYVEVSTSEVKNYKAIFDFN